MQVKERASKARPQVKQVKLLREDPKGEAGGAGKSRGMGFVEFTEHEHALCALRQLNNNPKPFGTFVPTSACFSIAAAHRPLPSWMMLGGLQCSCGCLLYDG